MAIDQKVLGYETHDKGIKFNQEAQKKKYVFRKQHLH